MAFPYRAIPSLSNLASYVPQRQSLCRTGASYCVLRCPEMLQARAPQQGNPVHHNIRRTAAGPPDAEQLVRSLVQFPWKNSSARTTGSDENHSPCRLDTSRHLLISPPIRRIQRLISHQRNLNGNPRQVRFSSR